MKQRLRELLRKPEIKGKRQMLLKKLAKVPASPGSKPKAKSAEGDSKGSTDTNNKGNGRTKPDDKPPTVEAGLGEVDWEQLLSEVIAAVELKIPEDDDLRMEVCKAIQDVFESKGLVLADGP